MAEASKSETKRKATKKAPAKKSAAAAKTTTRRKRVSPKAIEENFKPLAKKEIEIFRRRLLELRAELLGDVDSMRGDALKEDSKTDLSSMPIHMADIGTDNYEQEFTLGLIESERKLLRDIDFALARIVEGSYGVCVATGEPIGRARLEAKPYARYCIDFARKLEQGLVKEPSEHDEELRTAE